MMRPLRASVGQRQLAALCLIISAGCSTGPTSITPEQVRETGVISYAEACGGEGGAGILIDFGPDWDAVMGLLPPSTRSIWAAPDGYIASNLRDELTGESVVAKFRLDEGRVIVFG